MDWKQYFADFTPLLTFAAYTWAVCYFFYRLNERSIEKGIGETKEIIKEWRQEHKEQMQATQQTINEWRNEHKYQLEKTETTFAKVIKENEMHWREMFKYMNSRIDAADKAKP